MKIYVVCILYNNKISTIRSLMQILQLAETYPIEIFVEDNSREKFCQENNKEYEELYNGKIIYECNHANLGLSKAYNKAISKMENDSWVMLIDDDTNFSQEYLKNAFEAAMGKKSEVISGIVCCQKGYMSPTKRIMLRQGIKSNFVTEQGYYENIYCINSGLMYKISLIQKIGGYDENLFLDMVDYWFMEKLIEINKNKMLIVQGKIRQSFSGVQINGFRADLRRFKIFRKDFNYFCKVCNKSFFYKSITIIKRFLNIIIRNVLVKHFCNR